MIKRILTIIGLIGAILITVNFAVMAMACWIQAHNPMIIKTGQDGPFYTLVAFAGGICLASIYAAVWLASRLRGKPKPPEDAHF